MPSFFPIIDFGIIRFGPIETSASPFVGSRIARDNTRKYPKEAVKGFAARLIYH